MAAYILFIRESPVRDAEQMAKYGQMNRADPPDPRLTPLVVYGAMDVLEGVAADGVVLLQFPTMEDARDWYHSPKYQAASIHRKLGADYRAMIVQGL
jgi:uncharacterized protein (DUF1330 family)